ncbi:MAG TPA: chalcone isomerase family protein [Burkholderiales bacterium]|nr:chalcone isomerase family protein [Burkholderiales bacterium]
MASKLSALLLLALSLPGICAAGELEGIRMDEKVRVGAQELQLNGMALRKRAFFKVYVAGLYLPQKTRSAEDALRVPGAKRMTLAMLRDVGADTFAASLLDGLKENTSEAELAQIKPQVEELMATMRAVGEAKEGMVIHLEYMPDPGTRVLVGGAPQGRPIGGEGLFRALLRIWLGDKPVSADMKAALLGGA